MTLVVDINACRNKKLDPLDFVRLFDLHIPPFGLSTSRGTIEQPADHYVQILRATATEAE